MSFQARPNVARPLTADLVSPVAILAALSHPSVVPGAVVPVVLDGFELLDVLVGKRRCPDDIRNRFFNTIEALERGGYVVRVRATGCYTCPAPTYPYLALANAISEVAAALRDAQEKKPEPPPKKKTYF